MHITMQAFCRPFVLQSVSYCVCSLKTLEQLMCGKHIENHFSSKMSDTCIWDLLETLVDKIM